MPNETNNNRLPRVTIYARSGPLAGDLAACLSGSFKVSRVTSRAGALASLNAGCQALLIMGLVEAELGPADADLVKQALHEQCRVLILGAGGLRLGQDIDKAVVHLPSLPSPQVLFDALSGLGPAAQAGTA